MPYISFIEYSYPETIVSSISVPRVSLKSEQLEAYKNFSAGEEVSNRSLVRCVLSVWNKLSSQLNIPYNAFITFQISDDCKPSCLSGMI